MASIKYNMTWEKFLSANITAAILMTITAAGPDIMCMATDISSYYLRAVGAMYILLSKVYLDKIRFVGWWRSDTMIH